MSLSSRQPFGLWAYDHCDRPRYLGVAVTGLLVQILLVLVQILVLRLVTFDKVGRRDKYTRVSCWPASDGSSRRRVLARVLD